jgi:hypothetical protein
MDNFQLIGTIVKEVLNKFNCGGGYWDHMVNSVCSRRTDMGRAALQLVRHWFDGQVVLRSVTLINGIIDLAAFQALSILSTPDDISRHS